MLAADRPNKNALSLRLTESAVFLRTRPGSRSESESDRTSQPSMLRGLLVLDLAKPTRISSIELELKAMSSTAWPEGFGTRRVEVTEEHTVFHASVAYFRAGQARPTSVGPGISIRDGNEDWDDFPHTPSSPGPSRSPSRQRRWGSIDRFYRRPHTEHRDEHPSGVPPYTLLPPTPGMSSPATSPASSVAHLPLTPGNERPSTPSIEGHPRRSLLPCLPELNDRLTHEHLGNGQNVHDDSDCHTNSITRSFWRSITPNRNRDTSYDRQGRSHSRFSLASMSHALLDVVRPRQVHHGLDEGQIRGRTLEKGQAPLRDQVSQTRGRPLQKGQTVVRNQIPNERYMGSNERTTLGTLGDMSLNHHEEHKGNGVNWKEFKKGTYTYPISISIPGHCPPTLHCDYGNVTWRLKAVVHRPGAFTSKLTTTREVITVACPIEDDIEDSENIIVERHWDQQLQYLISISGRSFYIGGTIPVSFTLMPLQKVKIHKIFVSIEERVDYYTQMKRISRTEPVSRIVLLSVKGDNAILPLESNDVDAFRNSPLYNLATSEDDISEMASNLMGPGPWTFHQDLHLPHSCQHMHFSNMNKKSNIIITHMLKWIIRVERGDDLHINPKTGNRKLFDIVVQTPIHILSCRCNPEWSALPGYSERLSDPGSVMPSCPCYLKRTEHSYQPMFRQLERAASGQSSDSGASTVETSPVNATTMRSLRQDIPTLLEATSRYDRLVSGLETETGETPPAYEA